MNINQNKMKQTAVEWLAEKIQQANPTFKFDALIRQAKQMEKEQIVDAVKYGCSDWGSSKDAEQYYNGAFKSECYHPLTERKHTSDIHFECTICGHKQFISIIY